MCIVYLCLYTIIKKVIKFVAYTHTQSDTFEKFYWVRTEIIEYSRMFAPFNLFSRIVYGGGSSTYSCGKHHYEYFV